MFYVLPQVAIPGVYAITKLIEINIIYIYQ